MSYVGAVGNANGVISSTNPLTVEVSPRSTDKDAFGRMRVSLPQVLGFTSFEYGINTNLFETQLSGTGTVSATLNESTAAIRTGGAAAGALARIQTKRFFRYVPGRSQLATWTGSFATPTANVRQRCGYFSSRDGLFIEYSGTTLNLVRRTYTSGAAVDNAIPRSSWYDKFDGTGPSGVNLGLATGTTWLAWADLEWLGVGRYRFGFADPSTGRKLVAYEAAGTNVLAVPYMRTANLPMRWEIENTGAGADLTMKWICFSVDTEGGDEGQLPVVYPIDNGTTVKALASGTFRPVLALRAAAAGPGAVPNRGQIILEAASGTLTSGTTSALFRLRLNPSTLTQGGGAVTWTAVGNIAEYAAFSAVGDTIGGGTNIGESFYVPGTTANRGTNDLRAFSKFPLVYSELNSVQDTLVLEAAGVGGTPDCVGTMSFYELF